MSGTAPAGDNILLASQPIYDRANEVVGVELLYRNDAGQNVFDIGEDRATSELVFNFCTGITQQVDHFDQPAFINVTRDFLCSGAFLPIEPSKVMVELVERIEPDQELVEAVARWHAKGFRFALDDFEFKPSWEPLLKYADIIKVDVEQTSMTEVLEHRKQLARYPLRWLAERIETGAQHREYLDAGFDLFQGYFLARPGVVYGKKLSPAALNLAQLIGLLFADEPDVDAITSVLVDDPILSVSLLRIVNSPLYKTHQHISTMKEVVVRLGFVAIRRWAILISSLQASSPETARMILVRAQACAALAPLYESERLDANRAFLAGLLSGVDVMLEVDLACFLDALELCEDIKAAALHQRGPLGAVVSNVQRVERRLALKQDPGRINLRLLSIYAESARNVQSLFNEVS